MGLFDKKYCDICGNKIGMLGNRKLQDGNCCKDCAKKLSPFFDERRQSTVAQIKEQLAYREENRQAVAAFHTTRTFGEGYTMLQVDENARKFLVGGGRDLNEENPDVLDLSQVTAVNPDIRESRHELKQKDAQGKEVSYNPPRFEHKYDFYVVIRVNHPWFSEMRFRLNNNTLAIQELGAVTSGIFTRQTAFDARMSVDYQRYETMIREITECLQSSVPLAQQYASELFAAQQQAMAKAAPVDREKLIAEFRSDPAKAAQARALMGDAAFDAMMAGAAAAASDTLTGSAPAPAAGSCVCSCGATNTGRFCEYCGTPRP